MAKATKKVTTIPATLTQFSAEPVEGNKKKRVAAYARVSTDKDEQLGSYTAQVDYYTHYINGRDDWTMVKVYADEGISGLNTKHRNAFNQMVQDALDGKIEFMMTILASFAEEESRSISENVKWGLRKRMESGEIGIKNKHVFGYRYDENQQKYVIVPEEAEIVRYIFEQYAAGIKLRTIQSELEKSGIKSVNGYDFSFTSIHYILRNEIYIGDLKYQKCFVPDPILKNKVPNRGELPQYYISDCHEPVISRELFEQAQAETERRAGTINPVYCFTGKIRCGICGRTYSRNKNISRGKIHIYWVCSCKSIF